MNLMSRHRLGRPGGRDMGLTSRPGLLNWRSRHPLRSRHGAGCLVQCIVLCTVQVIVWTLFMDTVHEHCSQ